MKGIVSEGYESYITRRALACIGYPGNNGLVADMYVKVKVLTLSSTLRSKYSDNIVRKTNVKQTPFLDLRAETLAAPIIARQIRNGGVLSKESSLAGI